MIGLDEFKKILSDVGAIEQPDRTGFVRTMKLDAIGNTVYFTWYANKCSGNIRDIHICDYDDIRINGHYPNKAKRNINLLKDGKTVLVIPIEY